LGVSQAAQDAIKGLNLPQPANAVAETVNPFEAGSQK